MERPRYMRWMLPFTLGFLLALVVGVLFWWRFFIEPARAVERADERSRLNALSEQGLALRQELALLQEDLAARRQACVTVPETPPPFTNPPPAPAPPPVRRPPAPRPPEPMSPNNRLHVPDEARRDGTVDFMEGCWKSVSGLFSVRSEKPIDITYCFDKKGNGKRVITEQNQECVGRVQAKMGVDGKLTIRDTEVAKCPNGQGFQPYLTTCTTTGEAKCTMKNLADPSQGKVEATFERMDTP